MSALELGFGLLSIGRAWGAHNTHPPSRNYAFSLLEKSYELGIRFYDTAPAYGDSEVIFGEFVKTHGIGDEITIATKFGEHWQTDTQTTIVDHSAQRLSESLDRSLDRIGHIDVLQVHKATSHNLISEGVNTALEYARSLGVADFGASISDIDSAKFALETGKFTFLQFPLSCENATFRGLIETLSSHGITPIINRPFNMGKFISRNDAENDRAKEAFCFLKNIVSSGIVLTGTSNLAHLEENVGSFRTSQSVDS